MDKKSPAPLLLLLLLLLVSAGCVNRYSGCAPNPLDPANPAYTCCIPPGQPASDPAHLTRTCCPGTEPMRVGSESEDHCHYTLSAYWGNWQYVAILAVLISAFLVSIAYMAGHLFSNQMLIAWAKNELFQVMASALIVGSLIGVTFMVQGALAEELNNSVPGSCTSGTSCHILLAQKYLDSMYWQSHYMASGIVRVNTALASLKGLAFTTEQFAPPYFGIVLYPFACLGIPLDTMKTCLDILIKVMMLLKAQQMVLGIIQYGLFPVFLVMGLVLRSFFFTRKLGGLMIALAIGLFLVFPLVYVLAHNIWLGSIYKARDPMASYVNQPIGSPIVIPYTETDIENTVYPDGATPLDRMLELRKKTGGIAISLGRYVDGDFIIGDNGVLEKTGILLVYSTFMPFVALMVTIGFVRGLSTVLGGDVEIAGLTRVL